MEVIPAWCWPSRGTKAGELRLAISVSTSKPAVDPACSQHHLDCALLEKGLGWDHSKCRAAL